MEGESLSELLHLLRFLQLACSSFQLLLVLRAAIQVVYILCMALRVDAHALRLGPCGVLVDRYARVRDVVLILLHLLDDMDVPAL